MIVEISSENMTDVEGRQEVILIDSEDDQDNQIRGKH